jgi:lysophospholipid acyltransferase (LPLAT)-like uncharacterized protein
MAEGATQGRLKVQKVGWLTLVLLWVLALFAKLYYATLRFRLSEEDREMLSENSTQVVLAIWHNRILLSPLCARGYRDKRPIYAAISASKDGALISAFIGMLGVRSRRGSSSRGAAKVAMELMHVLKSGDDIAITPDGPRGPIYSFHEGAASLALTAKVPVVLVCPNPRGGWRANSWDGFYVPYPFSRVDLRTKRIRPEELPKDRAACAALLRKEMLALTEDLPAPKRCAAAQTAARGGENGAPAATKV